MTRTAAGILTMALLAPGVTATAGPLEVEYVQRLEMPARGDEFLRPNSVVADPATGEVFVCDTGNHRVAIFDARGRFAYQIVGGESFRVPLDLAVDPEGYIFLLAKRGERTEVLLLDFDGEFIGDVALDLPGDFLERADYTSIALSPAGDRLFVVDAGSLRLWITDRDGGLIGSIDFRGDVADDKAREIMLGHVDVYGETLVVSIPSAGTANTFDLDGRPGVQVGLKGSGPRQIGLAIAAAVDSTGTIFVVDKQRFMLTAWRPEGNVCIGEFLGIGRRDGRLYLPSDLALDAKDRFYVSQGLEGRVQVFQLRRAGG